jgi:hypothetical protein
MNKNAYLDWEDQRLMRRVSQNFLTSTEKLCWTPVDRSEEVPDGRQLSKDVIDVLRSSDKVPTSRNSGRTGLYSCRIFSASLVVNNGSGGAGLFEGCRKRTSELELEDSLAAWSDQVSDIVRLVVGKAR